MALDIKNPMLSGPAQSGGARPVDSMYVEKEVRLLVCTWNVGNKQPPADLSPWIPAGGGEYDLIVVGVQESTFKAKAPKAGASASSGAGAMPSSVIDDIRTAPTPDEVLAAAMDSDSDDEDERLMALAQREQAAAEAALPKTGGDPAAPASDVAGSAFTSPAATPAVTAGGEGFKEGSSAPAPASDAAATTPATTTPAAATEGAASAAETPSGASASSTPAALSPSSGAAADAAAAGGKPAARGSQWLSALVGGGIATYIKNANAVAASEKALIFEAIKAQLGTGWTEVRGVLMWQTGIIVMARNSTIASHIDAVESGSEATGVLGVGQNKGGTAVTLRLYGTPLAFINSHLAAHMKHVDDRNSNVAEILENVRIGVTAYGPYTPGLPTVATSGSAVGATPTFLSSASRASTNAAANATPPAPQGASASPASGGATTGATEPEKSADASAHRPTLTGIITAEDTLTSGVTSPPTSAGHTPGASRASILVAGAGSGVPDSPIDIDYLAHHCFVFGDMNYRIDMAIPEGGERGQDTPEARQRVLKLISENKLSTLLEGDQLKDSMREGKVLSGFDEGEVRFPPTFKVQREAGMVYKAQRVSSWCDRVLWRSHPGLARDVRCTSYAHCPEIATSDHKPVHAAFVLRVRSPYVPSPALSLPTVREGSMARVKFTNMRGKGLLGMDVSGLSDVYCKFFTLPDVIYTTHTSAAKAVPRSKTKSQTLTPVWADSEMPELRLRASCPQDLQFVHLVIGLMDYDQFDADDRMGQCIMHLGSYAQGTGTHDFTLPVVKAGVRHGELSGTIQITFPAPADDKEGVAGASGTGAAGGAGGPQAVTSDNCLTRCSIQ